MQVTISFNNKPPVSLTIDEWLKTGKIKGYCKANKIKKSEITEINYEPTNENNSSERKG